jgi:iron complex outermembrane receptor protein
VTGNWSQTDPLFQSQRPFISNDPRSNLLLPGSVGGNILGYGLRSPSQTNPTGVNATAAGLPALIANGTYLPKGSSAIVPFNIAPYTSLLQSTDLKSVSLDYYARINDKITFFGNALFSKTQTSNMLATSLSNLVQVGQTVPAGSPFNPSTSAISNVVVGTTDTPQQTINNSRAYLYTAGFRGNIVEDWNWEVGFTHSASMVEQRFTNTVFQPAFAAAIAGGFDANGNAVAGGAYSKVISGFDTGGPLVLQPALDPFARSGIDRASLTNVYGTEVATTHASLGSGDVKIVAMPFSLPAGKLAVAIGGTIRRETLSATPDRNSYNFSTSPTNHNWAPGAFFFDPFSHNRTVKAYFGEIRVPITSTKWNVPGLNALDLSLAGRSESYSDAGNSKVPKIGVRWQPFDQQITARFTYSKSFVAPTLVDEYGPPNYSLGPIPVPSGVNAGVSGYAGAGNNPALGPAYAWSRTFGITFSPRFAQGLTASADYVDVFVKGYQVGINSNIALPSVQALGAASPYFNTVYVHAAPGQPGSTQAPLAAPGSLYAYLNSPTYTNDFYYLDHKINAGGHRVKAVDFSVDYQLPTDKFGSFSAAITGTYLITDKASTSPDAPLAEFAGYSGSIGVFGGSSAKWTTYSTFIWKYQALDLTVGNFYRDHMVDINAGSIPAVWLATHPPVYVPKYISWDTSLGYTVGQSSATDFRRFLRGLTIRVGANNVFNRMPPPALLSYPASKANSNADTATYSPIGRLVYVSGSVRF